MGKRNIGGGGEHYFGAWCSVEGITVNPSSSDMNGWDALIEIDCPESTLDPLRVHEGIVEAKVQVKSTDGNKKYVDVELSNLHKMSTTLLPAFYILIEFDKSSAPVKAYLKHVDKVLVCNVLQRVSELVSNNQKVKLNKKKMRIHFTEEVLPLEPSTLIDLFKRYIGGSQSGYMEKKRSDLVAAGYDKGNYHINFSISDVQQLERFIDASLGKQGGIQVNELKAFVSRFGLSRHLPELSASNAVLSITNVLPNGKGKIFFRKKTTGKSLCFHADLYQGVINSFLPLEKRRIRIDAQLFEIFMRSDSKSMTIAMTPSRDIPYEIDDLLKAFSAYQMLREPEGVELILEFFGVRPTFGVSVTENVDDCAYQTSELRKIVDIKNYFEWLNPLLLTLQEIDLGIEAIDHAHALLIGSSSKVQLFFNANDGPPIGVESSCYYVANFTLGRYMFVDVLVINGIVEAESAQQLKVFGLSKVSIYKTVVELDTFNVESLKAEIEVVIGNHVTAFTTIDFTASFFAKVLGNPHLRSI